MDSNEKECYFEIADLLAQNKIKDAFGVIEGHLKARNFYNARTMNHIFVVTLAHLNRTEKEYSLQAISWEDYNISSSRVVKAALELALEICAPPPLPPRNRIKITRNREKEDFDDLSDFDTRYRTKPDQVERSFHMLIDEIAKLEKK